MLNVYTEQPQSMRVGRSKAGQRHATRLKPRSDLRQLPGQGHCVRLTGVVRGRLTGHKLQAAGGLERASSGSSIRWRTLKSTSHCLAISHVGGKFMSIEDSHQRAGVQGGRGGAVGELPEQRGQEGATPTWSCGRRRWSSHRQHDHLPEALSGGRPKLETAGKCRARGVRAPQGPRACGGIGLIVQPSFIAWLLFYP